MRQQSIQCYIASKASPEKAKLSLANGLDLANMEILT